MKRELCTLMAAAILALGATAAHAKTSPDSERQCFHTRDWTSWNAAPNGDVLYLRVNMNEVYQVGLTPGSKAYRDIDSFLVNRVRASSWICSARDLDLLLGDRRTGVRQGLIAVSMRKLTPAEVAAIPKRNRP
jgi:hypothetical protein